MCIGMIPVVLQWPWIMCVAGGTADANISLSATTIAYRNWTHFSALQRFPIPRAQESDAAPLSRPEAQSILLFTPALFTNTASLSRDIYIYIYIYIYKIIYSGCVYTRHVKLAASQSFTVWPSRVSVAIKFHRPSWNLEGGSYTGDVARWMKEGSRNGASLCVGAVWGEPAGRAPLLGTPKNTLSKTLEMGVCCHRGPAFGKHWWTVHSLGLWEKGYISLFGEFL